VRRSAGFDANQARRQFLEECQHVSTLQLASEHDIAFHINTVNLKYRLRDIETDCRDRLHDLAPPNRGRLKSTHIHGAHAPVEEPSTASTTDLASSKLPMGAGGSVRSCGRIVSHLGDDLGDVISELRAV